MVGSLGECGMVYAPSDANFLLMNLGAHHDDAVAALRQRGARFRDGRRWGLPGWIQVHLIDASVVTPVIDVIRSVAPGTIESPA
jgi:histidinol-phosphate/aromatic aminotransferase/cobyric acid decarboxylase-like protein